MSWKRRVTISRTAISLSDSTTFRNSFLNFTTRCSTDCSKASMHLLTTSLMLLDTTMLPPSIHHEHARFRSASLALAVLAMCPDVRAWRMAGGRLFFKVAVIFESPFCVSRVFNVATLLVAVLCSHWLFDVAVIWVGPLCASCVFLSDIIWSVLKVEKSWQYGSGCAFALPSLPDIALEASSVTTFLYVTLLLLSPEPALNVAKERLDSGWQWMVNDWKAFNNDDPSMWIRDSPPLISCLRCVGLNLDGDSVKSWN